MQAPRSAHAELAAHCSRVALSAACLSQPAYIAPEMFDPYNNTVTHHADSKSMELAGHLLAPFLIQQLGGR